MFDRLEKTVARYDELTALLSDPAVIRQQDKYRELSKEHSALAPLVQAYQKYRKARADVLNLREIINNSGDREMRGFWLADNVGVYRR